VACGNDAGTWVANMAEVRVDKATGAIQVVRLLAAQDMGVVVNPEGAEQQMEGCMTMGLGYSLAEEVHFKNGALLDTNFGSYQWPRFSWVPKIQTVLLPSDQPSQGGGEPAIVPMGAVLANAVFDAVGARLRQLPMTPARVLAAMSVRGPVDSPPWSRQRPLRMAGQVDRLRLWRHDVRPVHRQEPEAAPSRNAVHPFLV
jgi:CO/xanthine dehydrogenase Mo-binding subunit